MLPAVICSFTFPLYLLLYGAFMTKNDIIRSRHEPAPNRPDERKHPEEPWWRGAVIYQIYPRSFADADGDGIGDLKGILDHLDYIAALGVDAIWISPFFTSPMVDYGYDVADFCNVDPIFGTLDDFDAVLQKAHALGLKLIIDQVYSHSSDQHPWFLESRRDRSNPKADWYVWADPKKDGGPPNNWQSLFKGAAWTWDGRRKQYYLHNFLSEQPDLNLRNQAVQDAILDIARFWLDRGVDGFRLDAANFYMHDAQLRDNPPSGRSGLRPYDFQEHLYNRSRPENFAFIARLRALIDSYEDRFTVAEIGDHSSLEELISYVEGADRLHTAYSFVFIENDRLSAQLVNEAVSAWDQADNSAWPSWAFSNHDAPRVASRWGRDRGGEHDPRFAKTLNTLLCSLRGTVFIYQGQELGLSQADIPYARLADPEAIANWPDTLGRDGARTPMPWQAQSSHAGFSTTEPWLPIDPDHLALAADGQQADPGSCYRQMQDFLALRKNHPALRHGSLHFFESPEPIVAFERRHGDDRLLCAFNLGPDPLDWHPQSTGQWSKLAITGLDGSIKAGGLHLPPFGGCILSHGEGR
ncbi:alpha-glucosidase [Iodidimonas nitroreducens]|uniref:Alpha-glucosidase n=2 Tax=Iodidimonas nitroreducens TaxID=1236968 RepID=A0A5A7N8I3_9PROT|nr:alpha-glucosidase [Iodidimonas nitroreducens]